MTPAEAFLLSLHYKHAADVPSQHRVERPLSNETVRFAPHPVQGLHQTRPVMLQCPPYQNFATKGIATSLPLPLQKSSMLFQQSEANQSSLIQMLMQQNRVPLLPTDMQVQSSQQLQMPFVWQQPVLDEYKQRNDGLVEVLEKVVDKYVNGSSTTEPGQNSFTQGKKEKVQCETTSSRKVGKQQKEKPKKAKKNQKTNKKPRRALSAYNIFFQEQKAILDEEREQQKKNGDSMEIKWFEALGKIIGSRWKQLNSEAKKRYYELAEIDKKRYFQAKEEYERLRMDELTERHTALEMAAGHDAMIQYQKKVEKLRSRKKLR